MLPVLTDRTEPRRSPDESTGVRGRLQAAGAVWTVGAVAVALATVVLGVVLVGGASGPTWFGESSVVTGRQAAYGTGSGNTGDIGNAIAGNCATRFIWDTIRLKVSVLSGKESVTVDLANAPGATNVEISPGESHTFVLEKGSGHCRFAGPEGTITVYGDVIPIKIMEGFTNRYCSGDCTTMDVTLNGTSLKFREGDERALLIGGRIRRPENPAPRTAQLDLELETWGKFSPFGS